MEATKHIRVLLGMVPRFRPRRTSSPLRTAGFLTGIAVVTLLGACSQDASLTAPDSLEPARVSELPRPGSLESRVEGYAKYDGEPAYRCGGNVEDLKPGPRAFRTYVAQFDITANTYYLCQKGFHPAGQALDIYIDGSSQKQAFANWLTANNDEMAKRLGVVQIIWNRQIWLSYGSRPGTWGSYTGPDPHTSHVHLSFGTAGAKGTTSFFEEIIGSCTWLTIKEGSRGRRVEQVQYFLKSYIDAKLEVDGKFGPNTTKAVRSFQYRNNLEVDGVVGPNTWSKLTPKLRLGSKGNAVRVVQVRLGLKEDGKFGSETEAGVKALQRRNNLKADGVVGPNTWPAVVFGKGCK